MIGRLMFLVGVIAAMAWPSVARAQSTTGTTSGATIAMSTYLPVTRTKPRTSNGNDPTFLYTITRNDCKDPDVKYTFNLSITGYTSSMQVRAFTGRASNCDSQVNGSSTLYTCWEIGQVAINTSGSTTTATATFTPQQMMGITTANGVTPILNTCDDRNDFFQSQQSFNIIFYLMTNTTTIAAQVSQTVYYALQGPAPPATVNAASADSCLQLNWSAIGSVTGDVSYQFYCAPNEGPTDDACQSTVLSAAAVSGTAGASSTGGSTSTSSTGGSTNTSGTTGGTSSNAGAGGAASSAGTAGLIVTGGANAGGANASGATSAAGTANSFGGSGTAGDVNIGEAGMLGALSATGEAIAAVADTISSGGSTSTDTSGAAETAGTSSYSTVPNLDAYRCGSVLGKANNNGYTDQSLSNDRSYAVSVAVVDRYGNVGPLSNPVCMTPRQVDTFFDQYRTDGGKAGGGFCNIDLRRSTCALPIFGGSLLLLGWARRRRRISRPRRTPRDPNG